MTTPPHRCFFPTLRHPFFFFFFYLTPNMFKVHHSNNSCKKIKPIICRGLKQRNTCSFLDIQSCFVFFQSCKAVVGRKQKHKKSSYVGPSEYVSLCLCWRLLGDLSPLGDAGEFNFVLHPLPALQQTVKHKGEPRQSNRAHNLHQ